MISHCGFDLYFSDDVDHLHVLFGKMSVRRLPILSDYLLFCYCVVTSFYTPWILAPIRCTIRNDFLLFHRLPFHLSDYFLCCAKAVYPFCLLSPSPTGLATPQTDRAQSYLKPSSEGSFD